MPRRAQAAHGETCELKRLPCPAAAAAGCNEMVARKDVKDHLESAAGRARHADMERAYTMRRLAACERAAGACASGPAFARIVHLRGETTVSEPVVVNGQMLRLRCRPRHAAEAVDKVRLFCLLFG
jgi:hypothetical protein